MDNEKLELQDEPDSKDIWTEDPEQYRPPNLPDVMDQPLTDEGVIAGRLNGCGTCIPLSDDLLYAGQLSESQTLRQIYESEVVVR